MDVRYLWITNYLEYINLNLSIYFFFISLLIHILIINQRNL